MLCTTRSPGRADPGPGCRDAGASGMASGVRQGRRKGERRARAHV